MMIRLPLAILTASAALAIGASAALAGETHSHDDDHKDHKDHQETTSLEAHEHGSSELNIAVSGKKVVVSFRAPAADIVGFEHAPETKKQKKAIKAARKQLKKFGKLFVISASAKCKLKSAKVDTHGALESGHDHHHHDHDHKDKKKEAKAGEEHSEFEADYKLSCSKPGAITTVDFSKFFKRFPNSQEIDVGVVGDRGARTFEATRSNAVLTFPSS